MRKGASRVTAALAVTSPKNTADKHIGEARGACTAQASMLMDAIGEPESGTKTALFCGRQELFKLSPIIE
jgi:hypothetical protein